MTFGGNEYMLATKTVTIFTGFVEQEQLAEDMRILRSGLGGLRSIFRGRGVKLRTEHCDSEDLQEIREVMSKSDVCIFLFMTEISPLTRMQFDFAYQRLVDDDEDNNPSILVWFREAGDIPMSDDLAAFRSELRQDIGHFINRYTEIDTVQFQLLLHLEREGAGVPFVWSGTKLLDARGNVLMDFANTAAYSGNEKLQAVRQRLNEDEARQQELLERELDDDLSDDEIDELEELSERIAQETEEESKLQDRFLSDMRKFVSELADDRQMSPRRRKAIQLISIGRVREGYDLLDTAEIERDTRAHEARAKVAVAEAQSERGWVLDGVKQLLMQVHLLLSFVEERGEVKDEEIRHSYTVAIEFEERNGFEPLAAVGYGEYLLGLGVHDKAIDFLDGACSWYRRALNRAREAQYGVYVMQDPFMPDEEKLRLGLARALELEVRGEMAADAASSAAYAVTERIDILRDLYQPDNTAYGVGEFAEDLIEAARVMETAQRPDDALEYLEQACDLMEEDVEDDDEPKLLIGLVDALVMQRDLSQKLGRAVDVTSTNRKLLGILRRAPQLSDDVRMERLLVNELRDAAYDALGKGKTDNARAFTQEALDVELHRYKENPSTSSALSLSEGYRRSSVIAATMKDPYEWVVNSAQRLHVLVAEYCRVPTVDLQKGMWDCVRDLGERWEARPLRDSAECLQLEFLSLADAIEGIAASGESAHDIGCMVGDAIMCSVAMERVVHSPSDAEQLLSSRLGRLRAEASDVRGLAVYSACFEQIAKHLQANGKMALAYGMVSERLCALRVACGTETMGERSYAHTEEDVERLHVLVQALYYAATYAREHGRPAEGNAILNERLGLLRESFAVSGGLDGAYELNRALIESSEIRLANGDPSGMTVLLEEALLNARLLHDEYGSLATLNNLLYVGKRVDHRYREAEIVDRAEAVLKLCLKELLAYWEDNAQPGFTSRVAHIVWMYVVELRNAGGGELEQEVLSAYKRLTESLAENDAAEYLAYLNRRLNPMVDNSLDDASRRQIIEMSLGTAEKAYEEKEDAGKAKPDDLRTLSSVYELGILVAFGRGFDDQAKEYINRCIDLYEHRYENAPSQGGGKGSALSAEECASQLSKELRRLSNDLRKYGHVSSADELGERSTQILAELHEANPGSRVSFIYSAQLHNESLRLMREGRVEGGIALRVASTEVLNRYRLADPTERNLLWYTRSLTDLARCYRNNAYEKEADASEARMFEVLFDCYETTRSRLVLSRYLTAMSLAARRLQKTGEDNDRALDLYRKCENLAAEAFHRSPDVESARLLGQMQGYLYNHLRVMGRRDEARDLVTREVETQRYLFLHGPTKHGARVFEKVLFGETRRLRYLGHTLKRRDYLDQANNLHEERVQVMIWMARRDLDAARILVEELTKEITIVDPREPWIVKSMRRVNDEMGHKYPLHTGADRALVCQEALFILYREEQSVDLEEQMCNIKGVRVQFLLPKRNAEDGAPELLEERLERGRQAANELYELVPLLEELYAQCPDDAHAYRLSYYLKIAGVVFEEIGNLEDALSALERRSELLGAQLREAGDTTSFTKYTHALRDQARLLERMNRIPVALKVEEKRKKACRERLADDSLDERERGGVMHQLQGCLDHRENLLRKLGKNALTGRVANLEDYVELLRERVKNVDLSTASSQQPDKIEGEDAPQEVALEPKLESDERRSSYGLLILLTEILGRLASCRRDLGEFKLANSAYEEAICMLRNLEGAVNDADKTERIRRGKKQLLAERALLLAGQLDAQEVHDDASDDSDLADIRTALDDALSGQVNLSEISKDGVIQRMRLHQMRYKLLRSMGKLELALSDARASIACLDAVGEGAISPTERASIIAEWGKTSGECGLLEEAEQARTKKTEELRNAYGKQPTPELGLYLAYDLGQRAHAAKTSGHQSFALELSIEKLMLLCSLVPTDADQSKWKTLFRQTVRNLLSPGLNALENERVLAVLEDAEHALDLRAQSSTPDYLAAEARLYIVYQSICAADDSIDVAIQLERLGRYGRQVLVYGDSLALEAGALDRHARNLVELFAKQNDNEDKVFWLGTLRELFEVQWRDGHDEKVAQQLTNLYKEMIDSSTDAAEKLMLTKAHICLANELRCLDPSKVSDRYLLKLYTSMVEYAEAAGSPLDIVIGQLAQVDGDYACAEREDALLDPLATSITQRLEDVSEILKEQGYKRESFQLQNEAKNCSRNLGKPGWNWWRYGRASIRRPWRQKGELGAAQKRLQRASHVMRLSLEIGDWSHEVENYRNLRNLSQLRYEAYRAGLDAHKQLGVLNRLKWCLFNASTTLYQRRNVGRGLLAESIVLRVEMLEVLADMAVLAVGESRGQIEQEYIKGLRSLAVLLEGKDYEGVLVYADVRTWAISRAGTAREDLVRHAKQQ